MNRKRPINDGSRGQDSSTNTNIHLPLLPERLGDDTLSLEGCAGSKGKIEAKSGKIGDFTITGLTSIKTVAKPNEATIESRGI
jgi:hypothetical protein